MRALKVAVVGTRGVPGVAGGVESHCEALYPRLAAMGYEILILRRKAYVGDGITSWKGVVLKDLWCPRKKSLEAIWHSLAAVVAARRAGADLVHIHGIGPALASPLARLLGMRVIVTNHGPDYERAKWGRLARAALHLGEIWSCRVAHEIISISPRIQMYLEEHYGRDSVLIPNGVELPEDSGAQNYLRELGLEEGRYVLGLGRFVEEKNFHLLVEAFSELKPEGWKLVLAGDADHDSSYSESLKRKAREAGAILTGYVKGARLAALLRGAGLFVLPSAHEGLPISLLEAMSAGIDVLVSDIEANQLPELEEGDFFSLSDPGALREALRRKLNSASRRQYDMRRYDWDSIAARTAEVYDALGS